MNLNLFLSEGEAAATKTGMGWGVIEESWEVLSHFFFRLVKSLKMGNTHFP